MKTSKGYLFRAQYSKGVSHRHLHWVETKRQAEKWESFTVERREGSVCPDQKLLADDMLAVGGITGSKYHM